MNSISKKNTELRDPSITWLRAIATLMVVCTHIYGVTYWWPNNHHDSRFYHYFSVIFHTLIRPSVAIFAMISGYLLWSKQTEASLLLSCKRFWSIFKIITYFSIIYYLQDTFIGKGYYPFWKIFFSVCIPNDSLSRQFLWYMFAVLPLYTLTPFISLPLNKNRSFYIGFSIILAFIFFITESIQAPPFNIRSFYSLNMIYLYFLLGFSLGQINFQYKRIRYCSFFLFLTCALSMFFLEYININFVANTSLLIFIESLALFIFIRSLDFTKILSYKTGRCLDKIFNVFAKYSIGIYGWHIILRFIVYSTLQQTGLHKGIIILITLPFMIFGSLLIAIIDYHFWKKINKWLTPIYQKLKNTFYSFIQKYNIT